MSLCRLLHGCAKVSPQGTERQALRAAQNWPLLEGLRGLPRSLAAAPRSSASGSPSTHWHPGWGPGHLGAQGCRCVDTSLPLGPWRVHQELQVSAPVAGRPPLCSLPGTRGSPGCHCGVRAPAQRRGRADPAGLEPRAARPAVPGEVWARAPTPFQDPVLARLLCKYTLVSG